VIRSLVAPRDVSKLELNHAEPRLSRVWEQIALSLARWLPLGSCGTSAERRSKTMQSEYPWYIATAELAEMLFPEAGEIWLSSRHSVHFSENLP
jgi:hypothetical protein